MTRFTDTQISKAIATAYHHKMLDRIESDVLIIGAGPAGMTAAYYLAQRGIRTTVLEKRLSTGGGIWGGGMAMNEVAVQKDALVILDEFGVHHHAAADGLYTADSIELASALCLKAIQAGTVFLNLMTVEDVYVRDGKVAGVVVNRTGVHPALHVDPLTFSAQATIDATGHEAVIVETMKKKGLINTGPGYTGEGPMNAMAGESFVVGRAGEVFPGLWVAGMSVCATFGGPRMGPIFGGMLLSGKHIVEPIANAMMK